MLSYSHFRSVLVALALTTAAGPAVARPTSPHEDPTPPTAATAAKTGQTARPAQSIPALAVTSDTSAALQTVRLRGVVLTPDGRPCAGASVYPAGMVRQLVVTDAKGAFVLPVPAGTALALQVEYFGVGSSRVAIETPSAEPLRITLGK